MLVTPRHLSLLSAIALTVACADPGSRVLAPDQQASLARGSEHPSTESAEGALIYGLTSDGQLITFGTAQPNKTASSVTITGLRPGDQLVGLDFRPGDLNNDQINNVGKLYAVSTGSAGGGIYIINPQTGVATFSRALVTAAGVAVTLTGTSFGVGFNPVVDRLRVHSDAEQNLRINVDNGITIVDAALSYPAAPGVARDVTGTAYTNSDADATTGTELYAIDAARDVLVEFSTAGGPNSGQMVVVGALGVDTQLAVGFDIVGSANGTAYAALSTSPSGKSSLYSIDLDSGKATRLGLLAQTKDFLISIAVAP